ncbi:MAG: RecX family transcriptional regulator [Chloroflexota bacterium]
MARDATVFSLAGLITAITLQKRNKKRCNVYVDGEFAFALPAVDAIRLHEGYAIEDHEIEALVARDEQQRTYNSALQFLAHRPRSTKEVEDRLIKHGYSTNSIQAALERLAKHSFVNDSEFADYWVEQRTRFRPRGKHMLRYELRQKGINEAEIESALVNVNEDELCRTLALKWLQRDRGLPEDELNRKLTAHLARRGFAYSIIRDTLSELADEAGGRSTLKGD